MISFCSWASCWASLGVLALALLLLLLLLLLLAAGRLLALAEDLLERPHFGEVHVAHRCGERCRRRAWSSAHQ